MVVTDESHNRMRIITPVAEVADLEESIWLIALTANFDTDALRANWRLARRYAGGREAIAVVKADGYGHGAPLVARTLAEAGCGEFAVVTLDEGPRMMTNIVNCPQTPEALQLDMPLAVCFEPLTEEIALPYFEPAQEA